MNPNARQMFHKRKADADTRIGLGVGVFVLDSANHVLLEKRSDCGLWGLLGGRVEVGESIAEAARREVREETGLEVEILRLIGVYSETEDRIITYPDNGDVVHKIDVILEARIVSGALVKSHESEELRFFRREDFPQEICPPARRPVLDYLNGLAGQIR
ncbi:MAG: NUDIX domain-containing protein [Verrucomicrobia bacterium]|nr:NUDIX domain-containing protein [Verrucomicrobiota bacterium]